MEIMVCKILEFFYFGILCWEKEKFGVSKKSNFFLKKMVCSFDILLDYYLRDGSWNNNVLIGGIKFKVKDIGFFFYIVN